MLKYENKVDIQYVWISIPLCAFFMFCFIVFFRKTRPALENFVFNKFEKYSVLILKILFTKGVILLVLFVGLFANDEKYRDRVIEISWLNFAC